MSLTFLHTNDFHGTLTPEKAELIRKFREDADLYADSGDCIQVGNMDIPFETDPVWDLLQSAGCDIGVIGNRETHPFRKAFESKLKGANHPLVCANLIDEATKNPVLLPFKIFECKGMKIGFFGVMVPMITKGMWSSSFSPFLWESPLEVAVTLTQTLRKEVDILIALTHIGFAQDQLLAKRCPEIDLIFGGHSHDKLEPPTQIGQTWVCQTGSHGKFIGRYVWEQGKGLLSGEMISLDINKK